MEIPNIQGHCTRQALEQRDHLAMFKMAGRDYALVNTGSGEMELMLLLVVSDEEYKAWGDYFLRLVPDRDR